MVARQIDQSGNVAPIFTAVAKDLWPDLFRLLAILAIMLAVNFELAMVATITVLVYGGISWRLTRIVESDAAQYYGLWDEVATRVQQAVAGIKTVRTHSTESHEVSRILRRRVMPTRHICGGPAPRPDTRIFRMASSAFQKPACWASAGSKALEHQLTPGDVVMFLAYLDRLFAPIEGLTSLYTALQQHVVGVGRAQRLLEEPASDDEALPALQIHGGQFVSRMSALGTLRTTRCSMACPSNSRAVSGRRSLVRPALARQR